VLFLVNLQVEQSIVNV